MHAHDNVLVVEFMSIKRQGKNHCPGTVKCQTIKQDNGGSRVGERRERRRQGGNRM